MRKLIEKKQNQFIECDNPKCDYIVSVNNKKDLFLFHNRHHGINFFSYLCALLSLL